MASHDIGSVRLRQFLAKAHEGNAPARATVHVSGELRVGLASTGAPSTCWPPSLPRPAIGGGGAGSVSSRSGSAVPQPRRCRHAARAPSQAAAAGGGAWDGTVTLMRLHERSAALDTMPDDLELAWAALADVAQSVSDDVARNVITKAAKVLTGAILLDEFSDMHERVEVALARAGPAESATLAPESYKECCTGLVEACESLTARLERLQIELGKRRAIELVGQPAPGSGPIATPTTSPSSQAVQPRRRPSTTSLSSPTPRPASAEAGPALGGSMLSAAARSQAGNRHPPTAHDGTGGPVPADAVTSSPIFQTLLAENTQLSETVRKLKIELREHKVELQYYKSNSDDLRRVVRSIEQRTSAVHAHNLLVHGKDESEEPTITTLSILKANAADFDSIFTTYPEIALQRDRMVALDALRSPIAVAKAAVRMRSGSIISNESFASK
jgi:hypothetical protein